MIEGIIIFGIGFICGKYTDKVKDYCIKCFASEYQEIPSITYKRK